jgi:hypothetical protein
MSFILAKQERGSMEDCVGIIMGKTGRNIYHFLLRSIAQNSLVYDTASSNSKRGWQIQSNCVLRKKR